MTEAAKALSNGAGTVGQIADALRLLSKAPRNKGYERRLATHIVELGEARAELIKRGEKEQANTLGDLFIALAMQPANLAFFDRKHIQSALGQYRESVTAAEAPIRRRR